MLVPLSIIERIDEGGNPEALNKIWFNNIKSINDKQRGRVVQASALSQHLKARINQWNNQTEEKRNQDELLVQEDLKKRKMILEEKKKETLPSCVFSRRGKARHRRWLR